MANERNKEAEKRLKIALEILKKYKISEPQCQIACEDEKVRVYFFWIYGWKAFVTLAKRLGIKPKMVRSGEEFYDVWKFEYEKVEYICEVPSRVSGWIEEIFFGEEILEVEK